LKISKSDVLLDDIKIQAKPVEIDVEGKEVRIEPSPKGLALVEGGVKAEGDVEFEYENRTLIALNSGKPIKFLPSQVRGKVKGELKEIEIRDEEIPKYIAKGEEKGKLLGFIDVSVETNYEIDAVTGEVLKIDKPWWRDIVKFVIKIEAPTIEPGPLPYDSDDDGVLDQNDLCLDVPEDIDRIADWDGCPEEVLDLVCPMLGHRELFLTSGFRMERIERMRGVDERMKKQIADCQELMKVDSDNDCIPDGEELCDYIPEDRDGVLDWDGCPEDNMPDLVVSAFTGPSKLVIGMPRGGAERVIEGIVKISNVGTIAAENFEVRTFLSDAENYYWSCFHCYFGEPKAPDNPNFLMQFSHEKEISGLEKLEPGETFSFPFQIRIYLSKEADVISETFYLTTIVDADREVEEVDDDNNVVQQPIDITLQTCSLEVQVSPPVAAPGRQVMLTVRSDCPNIEWTSIKVWGFEQTRGTVSLTPAEIVRETCRDSTCTLRFTPVDDFHYTYWYKGEVALTDGLTIEKINFFRTYVFTEFYDEMRPGQGVGGRGVYTEEIISDGIYDAASPFADPDWITGRERRGDTLTVLSIKIFDNGEGDDCPHGPYGGLYMDIYTTEPVESLVRRIGGFGIWDEEDPCPDKLFEPFDTWGTSSANAEWRDGRAGRGEGDELVYKDAGIYEWLYEHEVIRLKIWESDSCPDNWFLEMICDPFREHDMLLNVEIPRHSTQDTLLRVGNDNILVTLTTISR
jgi:hypothetical protein